MPNFKYVARDESNRPVKGNLAAEDKNAVLEALRRKKLMVISIDEAKESVFFKKQGNKKVKTDDVVMFIRQLATMIDAGIPIIQTLDALHEQVTHPTFKRIIGEIRDDIQLGTSLYSAFVKHPKVFDALFVNMIRVGETGGVLSDILDRVAKYMEKTAKLKSKIQSAMIYPAVVISMAGIITIVLLTKVVPTFAGIYESFDRDLPALTQVLINVSDGLRHNLLWFVLVLIAVGILVARLNRTEKWGRVFDLLKLKVPVFGELIRKVIISRFCRTLATLIQSGVPILESLDIVAKTSGNRVLEDMVGRVKNSVREGESIATPLARGGIFPPMVVRMIAIGEKSGQMEKLLSKVADFYDDQVDTAVASLTSLIEPFIIGFLGLVVGFIVIALFLPIINLTSIL